MQRTPPGLEGGILKCYQRVRRGAGRGRGGRGTRRASPVAPRQITAMEGVVSYRDPRFWTMVGSEVHGTLVVVITHNANDSVLLASIRSVFNQVHPLASMFCWRGIHGPFSFACGPQGGRHQHGRAARAVLKSGYSQLIFG